MKLRREVIKPPLQLIPILQSTVYIIKKCIYNSIEILTSTLPIPPKSASTRPARSSRTGVVAVPAITIHPPRSGALKGWALARCRTALSGPPPLTASD